MSGTTRCSPRSCSFRCRLHRARASRSVDRLRRRVAKAPGLTWPPHTRGSAASQRRDRPPPSDRRHPKSPADSRDRRIGATCGTVEAVVMCAGLAHPIADYSGRFQRRLRSADARGSCCTPTGAFDTKTGDQGDASRQPAEAFKPPPTPSWQQQARNTCSLRLVLVRE